MRNPHIQAFKRLFNETARYENRYSVFRDWVMMSAIALNNAFLKSESLEEEYLGIVKRYKKDDAVRMAHLLAEVVQGLEVYPCDFLGSLFMELELGSDRMGQFFTPFEISKMMALLTHGDVIDELSDQPFIRAHEPACGSGSMIIAFAQVMYEKGLNPQQQLWVSCVDLDPVAAMMAYIQLSLLSIPGEIIVGNSLSMQYTRVMRTPAHYLGLWDYKLRRKNDSVKSPAEPVQVVEEPRPVKSRRKSEEQLSLFDVVM